MASKKESSKEAPATKEEEPIRGMQNTARLSVWIAVVIIVVALIGYLTSRSSFSEHDVAVGMKNLSKDISGYLEGRNYEGELSFASVTLKGSVFARVAVLNEPVFALRNNATGEELSLSTEYAVLSPNSSAMDSFKLVLEKPIVIKSGAVEYRVIPQLPNEIQVKRQASGKEDTLKYSSLYEEGMNFIVQTEGLPQAADSSYLIRLGAGSLLKGAIDLAEKSYYEEANLLDSSLEVGQTIVKTKELKALYEVAQESGDAYLYHYQVEGQDFAVSGAYEALGVFSLAFELEDKQLTDSLDHYVELNSLRVKGEDFEITGEGSLDQKEGDMLPYGALATQITSLDALLARLSNASLIPANTTPYISKAIARAGDASAGDGVLAVNFERTENGAFKIGNTTFEELTVSVLHDMVKGATAPAEPAEEPATVAPLETTPSEAAPAEGSAPVDAPVAKDETPATDAAEGLEAVPDATSQEVPAEEKPAADAVPAEQKPEDAAPAEAKPDEAVELKHSIEDSGDAIRDAQKALEELREAVKPDAAAPEQAPVTPEATKPAAQ